jgi:hypothetical protein
MNCKQIQRHASDYIDLNLPKSLVELIEEHLDECEICRKHFTDFKITISKLSILKHQVDFDCWLDIKDKLLPQNSSYKINYYKPFAFSFAAVVLVLIMVFVARPKPQAENIIYSANTHVNPYYAAHSAFQQSNPISGSDAIFIDANMNNNIQSGAPFRR